MVEETSQDGKVVELGFKQSGSIGHACPHYAEMPL